MDRVHAGSKLYTFMTGATYTESTSLEDFRNTSLPTTAKLLKDFRQRLYGVLLFEKPRKNGELRVSGMCMTGLGSLETVEVLTPEKPPDCHPGLNAT
jgi:hypothetical protein